MKDNDIEDMIAEATAFCKQEEKNFLESWCKEAGVKDPIAYDYDRRNGFIIYTNKPGFFIGKGGKLFYKYLDIMCKEFGFSENKTIKFVEIKNGNFINLN